MRGAALPDQKDQTLSNMWGLLWKPSLVYPYIWIDIRKAL